MSQHPAIFALTFDFSPDYHPNQTVDPAWPIDADNFVTLAFTGSIPAEQVKSLIEAVDQGADWYDDLRDRLEGEYGVLDWASTPDDAVLTLGNYHTYEVGPERAMELMEAFRSGLIAHTGGVFGITVAIPPQDVSDKDLYDAALEAGSVPILS